MSKGKFFFKLKKECSSYANHKIPDKYVSNQVYYGMMCKKVNMYCILFNQVLLSKAVIWLDSLWMVIYIMNFMNSFQNHKVVSYSSASGFVFF